MGKSAERVAALEDALASGELSVSFDGRQVTYRSTEDLHKAIAYFRGQGLAETRTPSVVVTTGGFFR